MSWLAELHAAHAAAAQLAVALRPDVPDLGVARERCELLLQRLDAAVASVAVAASKDRDLPAQSLRGDDDQDWDGPSFRYSPDRTG